MIVVTIILIIAAIAIPNLLRARIEANESYSVESLSTINSAQVTYQSTYPTVGYASLLAQLGPGAGNTACGAAPSSAAACLLDTVLASANAAATPKSGYYFLDPVVTVGGGINSTYEIDGLPAAANQTGVRGFCTDSDGVIHFENPAAKQGTLSNCGAQTALQ